MSRRAASALLRHSRVSCLPCLPTMLAGSRVRPLPSLPLPQFAGISGLAPRSGLLSIPPLLRQRALPWVHLLLRALSSCCALQTHLRL